jgi:3-oxoacyl-[acyl-carrier protein] reductase
MDDLKVALVAGASTGPGRAIAVELRRAGWSVVAQVAPGSQDVEEEPGAPAEEPTAEDEQLVIFEGDLATEADRERFIEDALERFERIDLLVAPPLAPASQDAADLLELTLERAAAALAAGALASMILAQRTANEMIRLIEGGTSDGGKIIFLGSVAAYTTSADQGLACLNSAAVAMLTRLFADRLGEYGINVYEVRCGLMATSRAEPGYAQYDRLIREGLTPIRRWGRPADIARAVAAIAADELAFSTGQVLNVDGGFHLRRL